MWGWRRIIINNKYDVWRTRQSGIQPANTFFNFQSILKNIKNKNKLVYFYLLAAFFLQFSAFHDTFVYFRIHWVFHGNEAFYASQEKLKEISCISEPWVRILSKQSKDFQLETFIFIFISGLTVTWVSTAILLTQILGLKTRDIKQRQSLISYQSRSVHTMWWFIFPLLTHINWQCL